MYQTFFTSLELWHHAAIAFGCYYFGNRARRTSRLASSAGIPVGIAVAVLLAAEGCYASNMEIGEFVSVEFVRLGLLVVMTVGACSILLKVAEPIIAEVKKNKENLERSAEKRRRDAQYEQAAKENAARWEAERPAREAQERQRASEDRKRESKKQQAARQAQDEAYRRDRARRRVLLVYHKCSPKIQDVISWERLQEYIKTFMTDNMTADEVVSSGDRMVAILQGHVRPQSPKTVKRTVIQIVAQYDAEREQLINAGLSQEELSAHLAELEMRRVMALEKRA